MQNSVVKSEVQKAFVRPRYGWEDNIRLDLREIRWEVVDWLHQ
jgi:hypothetical protein